MRARVASKMVDSLGLWSGLDWMDAFSYVFLVIFVIAVAGMLMLERSGRQRWRVCRGRRRDARAGAIRQLSARTPW